MEKFNYKKILATNDYEINLLSSILTRRFEILPDKLVYPIRARIFDNFYILHVPLLIIGSNPFINLLLCSKILNNNIDCLIHMPNYEDMWSYKLLENDVFKKIFNIGFEIEDNNNFFSSMASKTKSLLLSNSSRFGLMSDTNISVVSNNKTFQNKSVFSVNNILNIKNFEQLKKNTQSNIYNKIFNDFKNTFNDFEIENFHNDNKKQVFIVADNVLHASFLPYIEAKSQDNVYVLGSHSNCLQIQSIEDLKVKNVKSISEVIFSNDLNIWLKNIVGK